MQAAAHWSPSAAVNVNVCLRPEHLHGGVTEIDPRDWKMSIDVQKYKRQTEHLSNKFNTVLRSLHCF